MDDVDGRCRDGYYRGCDFMGCDDLNVQLVELGRRVSACRLHGPPDPALLEKDTTVEMVEDS